MYAPGHVGLALLAYTPLAYHLERTGRWRTRSLGAAAVVLVGVWPDVDSAIGLVHRGITHTVWAALFAGVVLAALAATGGRREVGLGFGVGAGGTLSHLVGDVLTPMGLRPFAPVFTESYTLAVVSAADPQANYALLAVGVATFALGVGTARGRIRVPEPLEGGA